MAKVPEIAHSIRRVRTFAASWNEGDLIDEDSGVTKEDLLAVATSAEMAMGMTFVERLK